MAYSLNLGEGSSKKITKFAPESYSNGVTTITGFASNVGIKNVEVGQRGLAMTFYRMEEGEELTLEMPLYAPTTEKQGGYRLSVITQTLFAAFGKKTQEEIQMSPIADLELDSWNKGILELASNFTFPSPIVEESVLKVVLNKKGWQTVSNEFPVMSSPLHKNKVAYHPEKDKLTFTKEAPSDVNKLSTDLPVGELLNFGEEDKLPF